MRNNPRWKEQPSPVIGARAFVWGHITVLVSQHPRTGWHISVSHPFRYPTWDEICAARYDLTPPDIEMVMHLPRKEEYVNIHKNCFHLFEFFDNGEKIVLP